MTDLERLELAIRRDLAKRSTTYPHNLAVIEALEAVANAIADSAVRVGPPKEES